MNKKLVIFISFVLFLFIFLIGFDFFPQLRGPAPYPPDWQWAYQFTNTLSRIWLPILVIATILVVGFYFEKKQKINLFCLVLLSFLFQISILFFSRSGVLVLIHRIIDPNLNGYFTTALRINNIGQYLSTYNQKVLSFYMHATGHMPGAILFFWLVNRLALLLPVLNNFVGKFSSSHADVDLIWNSLLPYEKTGAAISSLLIPFLSSLSLIPIYFIAKKLYGIKTAIRACLLYLVVPSINLFIPISDVFFPLFFLFSFLAFLNKKYILAGIIFSLGLFFSLSLIPLLLIFLLKPEKKTIVRFFSGLLILPLILLIFFKFNIIEVSRTLMKGLPPHRSYLTWIFYNLYDFFIFTGIPISILFFMAIYKRIKDPLLWAFTLMLLLLNFSGSVRGETGRIWLPYAAPLILATSNFLTNKLKLSNKLFFLLVLLQAIQILAMQEFWVMLW